MSSVSSVSSVSEEADQSSGSEQAAEAVAEPERHETTEIAGTTPAEGAVGEKEGDQAAEAEKAEAASKSKEEAAAPVVAPPALSPLLIARAVRAGLKDDEISEAMTEDKLDFAVRVAERRASEQAEPDSGASATAEETKIEPIPDLDPSEYAEPFVKGWQTMKTTVSALHQQLTATRQQLAASERREQVRAASEFGDWFEKQVGGLGDDVAPTAERQKPEFRSKTLTALESVLEAHKRQKRTLPAREELFQQAVRLAFPTREKEKAQREVQEQLDKRKKQMTSPPTQRAASEGTSPRERQRLAIREKLDAIKKGERASEENKS